MERNAVKQGIGVNNYGFFQGYIWLQEESG